MTLFFVLVYVLGPLLTKLIKKVYPDYLVDEKQLEIEVEIDNYWSALDDDDKHYTISEEANSRTLLGGIKIMTDDSYERLKAATPTRGNTLMGTSSYDILANNNYSTSF
jgi:hypothetical protein